MGRFFSEVKLGINTVGININNTKYSYRFFVFIKNIVLHKLLTLYFPLNVHIYIYNLYEIAYKRFQQKHTQLFMTPEII